MFTRGRAANGKRLSGKEHNRRNKWFKDTLSCASKIYYMTCDDAEAGLMLMTSLPSFQKSVFTLAPYKCPHCPGYHIGHNRPPELRGASRAVIVRNAEQEY